MTDNSPNIVAEDACFFAVEHGGIAPIIGGTARPGCPSQHQKSGIVAALAGLIGPSQIVQAEAVVFGGQRSPIYGSKIAGAAGSE